MIKYGHTKISDVVNAIKKLEANMDSYPTFLWFERPIAGDHVRGGKFEDFTDVKYIAIDDDQMVVYDLKRDVEYHCDSIFEIWFRVEDILTEGRGAIIYTKEDALAYLKNRLSEGDIDTHAELLTKLILEVL